ncbi:TRAP transporter small permease [Roseisalinus antarcticus]|uniref:TRAP transporter small permease protein n=1 Tax=Roseisalinus antarcticus TaxID=254357 RepID=A0A1Y5RVY6_9RHOB|nr:TRAP transporter small permease [Roseisalinus antarcticus]SLN26691.1 Tripartite ATP-independent periplasmic transporters, DctQ component [Roseisalinus antarcticus]
MPVRTATPLVTALTWLRRGADMVGVLLFLSAFCGFIVQVFWRYVLNNPLAWTEEFVMICFIWTVFWAAAFLVPVREHVSFDVVYDMAGPRTRRRFDMITLAAIVVAFVWLVPYTWDYLQFLTRKKSPVLRIQMHWIYGCYMLFVSAFALQSAWRLYEIFRAGPETEAEDRSTE